MYRRGEFAHTDLFRNETLRFTFRLKARQQTFQRPLHFRPAGQEFRKAHARRVGLFTLMKANGAQTFQALPEIFQTIRMIPIISLNAIRFHLSLFDVRRSLVPQGNEIFLKERGAASCGARDQNERVCIIAA